MQTFTDARGTEWRLQLDLVAAIRVDDARIQHRDRTLLLTDPDKWVFNALMRSPRLQADVLFVLLAPQAEKLEVSRDQFRERLFEKVDDGAGGEVPVLTLATGPLARELNDFFRSCPISTRRLLRAQNQLLSLLEDAEQTLIGLNNGTRQSGVPTNSEDATLTTSSSDSPQQPESTGELPE